jgi:hypothetical protein
MEREHFLYVQANYEHLIKWSRRRIMEGIKRGVEYDIKFFYQLRTWATDPVNFGELETLWDRLFFWEYAMWAYDKGYLIPPQDPKVKEAGSHRNPDANTRKTNNKYNTKRRIYV